MDKRSKALAVWKGLNPRQREYLAAVFREDQAEEQHRRGAFSRGEEYVPASEWRWIEYGWVHSPIAGLGRLQQVLSARGLRDSGAGSTWDALEERRVIITDRDYDQRAGEDAYLLKIQMTPLGRDVCKEGGLALGAPKAPAKGLLSETLWRMLAEVRAAGDGGLRRPYADGAWTRLTGRKPEPFIRSERSPEPRGRDRVRLFLTDAGEAHYREQWEAYAARYPRIPAPHPDGTEAWPAEADGMLGRLREECLLLSSLLKGTAADLAGLQKTELPREKTPLPDGTEYHLARSRDRRDAAAGRLRAAWEEASSSFRQALERHEREVQAMYGEACTRYMLAAHAAVVAAVDGTDPAAAVEEAAGKGQAGPWPHLPPLPVSGAAPVDSFLESAYVKAGGQVKKTRRRARQDEPDPVRDATRLYEYAHTLTGLVGDGYLVKLLPGRDRAGNAYAPATR